MLKKEHTPTPFATDLSLSIDTVDGVDYLVLSGNQPDDDMTGLYLAAYNIRGPKDLIEKAWDTGSFENRIELDSNKPTGEYYLSSVSTEDNGINSGVNANSASLGLRMGSNDITLNNIPRKLLKYLMTKLTLTMLLIIITFSIQNQLLLTIIQLIVLKI